MNTVGALRIRSSRPGAGDRGETGADRVDIELPLRARAEERLHRGQRHHRVVGLMFAVQRQEDIGVDPAETLQLQQLSADAICRSSTANSESSRATAASARTACARITSIASGTCCADDRDGVDGDQVVGLPS